MGNLVNSDVLVCVEARGGTENVLLSIAANRIVHYGS